MNTPEAPGRSRWFWPGLVIGWTGIWFGWHNVIRSGVDPTTLAKWLVGSLLAHDALWAPVAALLGVITARWLAPWLRGPFRVALGLSAMLILASRPVVARYGALADNPSVDPTNAGDGLLIILALVWSTATASALVLRRRPAYPT